jgi:hypothetical protein
MSRGGKRPGAGRKPAKVEMKSINLSLRKITVDRLKAESKKRNPDNKRAPIGYIIDELVERYLSK